MDKRLIIEYCLAKEGAYPDFPFAGDDYFVVKAKKTLEGKSRIFAEIFTLKGVDTLTFSTDAETAAFLRQSYPDVIVPGWHCPPAQAKYKSSVALDLVDEDKLYKFIDASYCYVLSKL